MAVKSSNSWFGY